MVSNECLYQICDFLNTFIGFYKITLKFGIYVIWTTFFFLNMVVDYCHHLIISKTCYFLDALLPLQTCFSNGVLKCIWLLVIDSIVVSLIRCFYFYFVS